MRERQTAFTRHPAKAVLCISDSFGNSRGVDGILNSEEWIGQLQKELTLAGCNVRCINCGVSGNTTANMLARMPASMLQVEKNTVSWDQCRDHPLAGLFKGVPAMTVMLGGHNNPGNGVTTTQADHQQISKYVRCKCSGVAANPAALPANLPIGARYVVTSDNSSTGGLAATVIAPNLAVSPYSVQFDKVAGAGGNAIRVWQNRTGAAGEAGWGRINDPNDGCPYVLFVTEPYQNFTPGGDTTAGINATWAPVRTAQLAAGPAEDPTGANVATFDLWQALANLITAGVESQNSNSWGFTGVASPNPHPGPHGARTWGQLIANDVLGRSAWVKNLKVA